MIDSKAKLWIDIASYAGTILWDLLKALCRIHIPFGFGLPEILTGAQVAPCTALIIRLANGLAESSVIKTVFIQGSSSASTCRRSQKVRT